MGISYRKIRLSDLPDLVKIHKKIFPDYFLTSLGDALLNNYYKAFLEENPSLFYGAFSGDKIIGFSLGYLIDTSRAKEHFEHQNKRQLAKRLFFLCLRLDPKAISRCFRYIFKKKNSENCVTGRGSMLVLGVLPEYRSQGVATSLMLFLFEGFQGLSIAFVETASRPDNFAAIHFWNNHGGSFFKHEGKDVYFLFAVNEACSLLRGKC